MEGEEDQRDWGVLSSTLAPAHFLCPPLPFSVQGVGVAAVETSEQMEVAAPPICTALMLFWAKRHLVPKVHR